MYNTFLIILILDSRYVSTQFIGKMSFANFFWREREREIESIFLIIHRCLYKKTTCVNNHIKKDCVDFYILGERERERERERETMTGPQTADAQSNALSPVYFWKTGLALFPWYVLFGRVRKT